MTTLSRNYNEAAWQCMTDKANAAAKEVFDRRESAKLRQDAHYVVQTFVPETWQDFAERIISGLEAAYSAQQKREETAAHLAIIESQDAETIRLLAIAAQTTGPTRESLAASVRGLTT